MSLCFWSVGNVCCFLPAFLSESSPSLPPSLFWLLLSLSSLHVFSKYIHAGPCSVHFFTFFFFFFLFRQNKNRVGLLFWEAKKLGGPEGEEGGIYIGILSRPSSIYYLPYTHTIVTIIIIM